MTTDEWRSIPSNDAVGKKLLVQHSASTGKVRRGSCGCREYMLGAGETGIVLPAFCQAHLLMEVGRLTTLSGLVAMDDKTPQTESMGDYGR